MSWASDRVTTRREDIAYCLMGLFDVNMAMLYGEGQEKAFRRLQEEIMKDSDDETLFAWTRIDGSSGLKGLLAESPKDFRDSGHYIPDYDRRGHRVPFSITSKGLCITLGLQLLEGDVWIGAVECPVPPSYGESLAIYLRRLDKDGQQYARIKADRLCKIPQKGPRQTIYVRQHPLIPGFDDVYLHHVFQLRNAQIHIKGSSEPRALSDLGYYLVGTAAHSLSKNIDALPTTAPRWVPPTCQRTFQIPRGTLQLAGALAFRRPDGDDIVVMLGSKPGYGPAVDIIKYDDIAKRKEQESKRISMITSGESESILDTYFRELESIFDPQTSGEWVDLGQDKFRVDIQPRAHAGMRYYMVDVMIEETPRLRPEDLLNLGGIVPGLPNLQPEFAPEMVNGPTGSSKKWRNPFKSSSK